MMTQKPGAVKSFNEQSNAQSDLQEYLEAQPIGFKPSKKESSEFQLLSDATENIISHAKWLEEQYTKLNKADYKQLIRTQGWKSKEEKLYLKVAKTFEMFTPQDLTQVEPRTIFLLAQNNKKYQPVIDELADLPEITQAAVRDLMEAQRKPKTSTTEKPSIWRMTKSGERYCQIPPIREESQITGTILQAMMDKEGKSAQAIVAECMQLKLDLLEGRLIRVETEAQVSNPESEFSEDIELDVEEAVNNHTEETDTKTLEVEVSDTESNSATGDCVAKHNQVDHLYNKPLATTENQTPEPNNSISSLEDLQDIDTPVTEESEISISKLTPLEQLIYTFQNATSWKEISEALKIHSDCKEEAWDALTPLERRRVTEITPPEIQKLSRAKRVGKIVDFREVREGIYKIQLVGSLSWEVVNKFFLDNFLAQLYHP